MINDINTMINVNTEEIEKFRRMADEWWDAEGKFKPLHEMNRLRLIYLRDCIKQCDIDIKGKKLLDVGCGGGLVSEPMSRLGANVLGVDAVEKNIEIATLHSVDAGLNINYRHCTIEDIKRSGERFDIVLALEIVEHIDDVEKFIIDCLDVLNDGGIIFISTINRTYKAYGLAILGAEYILRWLPRGTHDWKKFVKPSEIKKIWDKYDVKVHDVSGMTYSVLQQNWKLSSALDVNYIICGIKDAVF